LDSYSAIAGIGPFNGSLVVPYIQRLQKIQPNYPLKIMPYSTIAVSTTLMSNPLYSLEHLPIACQEESCQSILMSGGAIQATPNTPPGYSDPEVIVIKDVMSRQLEFQQGIPPGDTFKNKDCVVYNDNATIIAMQLCVKESTTSPGSIIAGQFHFHL
jgi:hypothetical protein